MLDYLRKVVLSNLTRHKYTVLIYVQLLDTNTTMLLNTHVMDCVGWVVTGECSLNKSDLVESKIQYCRLIL